MKHTRSLRANLFTTHSITAVVAALVFYVFSPTSASGQQFMFSSGGGAVSLNISTAIAGTDPESVSDNSTELYWDANFGVPTKITATTSCPSQSYSLWISLAITSWASGTIGTEQPEFELIDGMPDRDLLRDIPASAPARQGYGNVTYRAAATASDGNSAEHGDDFHTITLTVIAQ